MTRVQRNVRVFAEHATEDFNVRILGRRLDGLDARVEIAKVELRGGEFEVAARDRAREMFPLGGAWDAKNALERFDLATVTAAGPDAEEALEATVHHLEAEPEVWCPHRRAARIREWLLDADPERVAGIVERGEMTPGDRHHLSEIVWRGRALWPSLRDCFLGESESYVAKVEARRGVGRVEEAAADGPTPVSDRGRDALRDLLRWQEDEAPELREIADRIDEDGRYGHAEETRREVARRVLRFREVTDPVLDAVDLKPPEAFLGSRALTYLRLGWI